MPAGCLHAVAHPNWSLQQAEQWLSPYLIGLQRKFSVLACKSLLGRRELEPLSGLYSFKMGQLLQGDQFQRPKLIH